MKIKIKPSVLNGKIKAISSKSQVHRMLIAAALADGETAIFFDSTGEDIDATVDCLTALGAKIEKGNGCLKVTPIKEAPLKATIDCRESGSTLRFLLPVAGALGVSACFTGSGRLPSRPIMPLRREMENAGISFSEPWKFPIEISGKLEPGAYQLKGDVSSQFVTGLLVALPLLDGDSTLRLIPPVESRPYIDMTLEVLSFFGIKIEEKDNSFFIKGAQKYRSPETLTAEGDWSNAAFFLAAGALGGDGITAHGLNPASVQGDRAIAQLLERFGAIVTWADNACTVKPGMLHAIPEIDVRAIPDLVPILAVVAGVAQGTTVFTNAARLRLKESDRLETTARLLRSVGGKAETTEDSLIVTGVDRYHGGTVDSCNDHRIAMAAAVAATRATGTVTLENPAAVAKSWPDFFTVCGTLR